VRVKANLDHIGARQDYREYAIMNHCENQNETTNESEENMQVTMNPVTEQALEHYRPTGVTIAPNGSAVVFYGSTDNLKPFADWLYNIGATDSEQFSIGAMDCITLQTEKLVSKLAFAWHGDIANANKGQRATRKQLVAQALVSARSIAETYLALFPRETVARFNSVTLAAVHGIGVADGMAGMNDREWNG
jgi:hypothetical protein